MASFSYAQETLHVYKKITEESSELDNTTFLHFLPSDKALVLDINGSNSLNIKRRQANPYLAWLDNIRQQKAGQGSVGNNTVTSHLWTDAMNPLQSEKVRH